MTVKNRSQSLIKAFYKIIQYVRTVLAQFSCEHFFTQYLEINTLIFLKDIDLIGIVGLPTVISHINKQ